MAITRKRKSEDDTEPTTKDELAADTTSTRTTRKKNATENSTGAFASDSKPLLDNLVAENTEQPSSSSRNPRPPRGKVAKKDTDEAEVEDPNRQEEKPSKLSRTSQIGNGTRSSSFATSSGQGSSSAVGLPTEPVESDEPQQPVSQQGKAAARGKTAAALVSKAAAAVAVKQALDATRATESATAQRIQALTQPNASSSASAGGLAAGNARRAQARSIAENRAVHFARYNAEEEDEEEDNDEDDEDADPAESWPGPFSTARQLHKGRAKAVKDRKKKLAEKKEEEKKLEVQWTPSNKASSSGGGPGRPRRLVGGLNAPTMPTLLQLTVDLLCDNIEGVESLVGMPDAPRALITRRLCQQRQMTPQAVGLLTAGAPADVDLPDCALLNQQDLTTAIKACLAMPEDDAEETKEVAPPSSSSPSFPSFCRLESLHLGYCGRGLTDTALEDTFGKSVGCAMSLRSLQLHGAYRLTDQGLNCVLSGAPLLSLLSVTDAPKLTTAAISAVATSLAPTLTGLVLDGCSGLSDSEGSLRRALCSLLSLQQLSLADVPDVGDELVASVASYWGRSLHKVCLRGTDVTDVGVSALASSCPNLRELDVSETGISGSCLQTIAASCPAIQVLWLNGCLSLTPSSDSCGLESLIFSPTFHSLTALGLAQVPAVDSTLIMAMVGRGSEALERIDLSWCRNVSENAVGRLTDAFGGLTSITLFGCTQITKRFDNGVANDELRIIR